MNSEINCFAYDSAVCTSSRQLKIRIARYAPSKAVDVTTKTSFFKIHFPTTIFIMQNIEA